MSHLVVRDLDVFLAWELHRRAAQHGRSPESEHREILIAVLGSPSDAESFKTLLGSMPDVGLDEELLPPDHRRPLRRRGPRRAARAVRSQ